MATIGTGGQGSTDQKNKEKENQAGTGSQNFASSGGAGRLADFSSGTNQSATGASNSGRFTNLKNYLGANQQAGQQLGDRITGGLTRDKEKATKDQQSGTAAIADQVNKEQERLGQGQTYADTLKTETGAQNIYGNQADRDAFGNLLNQQGNYQNINTNLNTTQQNLQSNLNNLQSNVQNLGTEQGRFQLLQNNVKGPNYTTGQQRLDQLFLQTGDPSQLVAQQQGLNRDIGRLGNELTDFSKATGESITGLQQQEKDVAALLGSTLSGEESNVYNAANALADASNKSNVALNNVMNQYFSGGYNSLTPEQKQTIDAELARNSDFIQSGMRTYNLLDNGAYENYINQADTNYANNMMNQDQFEKYNALLNLSGLNPATALTNQLAGDTYGDAQTSGILGEKLGTDVSSARSDLENLLNSTRTFDRQAGSGYITNSTANYLDLLKVLEQDNNTGSWNGTAGQPVTATNAGRGDNAFNLNSGNRAGQFGVYLDPWDVTASGMISRLSSGGTKDSQYKLLQDFLSTVKKSGYEDTLGGTAANNFLPTKKDT